MDGVNDLNGIAVARCQPLQCVANLLQRFTKIFSPMSRNQHQLLTTRTNPVLIENLAGFFGHGALNNLVQGVNDRIAGDHNPPVLNTFAEQIVATVLSWSKM